MTAIIRTFDCLFPCAANVHWCPLSMWSIIGLLLCSFMFAFRALLHGTFIHSFTRCCYAREHALVHEVTYSFTRVNAFAHSFTNIFAYVSTHLSFPREVLHNPYYFIYVPFVHDFRTFIYTFMNSFRYASSFVATITRCWNDLSSIRGPIYSFVY